MINQNAHLTDSEINRLNNDQLSGTILLQALEHIEQCEFCANRIPLPVEEENNRVFFNKFDAKNNAEATSSLEAFGISYKIVLTAVSLAVIFLFGYYLLSAILKLGSSNLVVANSANKTNDVKPPSEANISNLKADKEVGNSLNNDNLLNNTKPLNNTVHSSPRVRENPRKPKGKPVATTRKAIPNLALSIAAPLTNSNNIATATSDQIVASNTRSISRTPDGCAKSLVKSKIENKDGQITISWERVKEADKYHLYVSDNSQVLQEEFETAAENSYILKNRLKTGETYKWKIAVTLKNGRTFVGETNTFKIGEDVKIIHYKKGNGSVRCS